MMHQILALGANKSVTLDIVLDDEVTDKGRTESQLKAVLVDYVRKQHPDNASRVATLVNNVPLRLHTWGDILAAKVLVNGQIDAEAFARYLTTLNGALITRIRAFTLNPDRWVKSQALMLVPIHKVLSIISLDSLVAQVISTQA